MGKYLARVMLLGGTPTISKSQISLPSTISSSPYTEKQKKYGKLVEVKEGQKINIFGPHVKFQSVS